MENLQKKANYNRKDAKIHMNNIFKNYINNIIKNYIKAKDPKRIVPFQFDWNTFFTGKELI